MFKQKDSICQKVEGFVKIEQSVVADEIESIYYS